MALTSTPIKIIIADSQQLFREGLKAFLKKSKEIIIIAEADNSQRLINLVEKYEPHIILTDIELPSMAGLKACKYVHEHYPIINLIGLASNDEENLLINSLKVGVRGFLLKNASKEEMIHAIKRVHSGEIYYCNSVVNKVINLLDKNKPNFYKDFDDIDLSSQEMKIINMLCKEMTSKEIAERLNLSRRTVEDYRCKILEKTGTKSSVGIALFAIKKGFVKLEKI